MSSSIRSPSPRARRSASPPFAPGSSAGEAAWNAFVERHADATAYHQWGWRRVFERAFGHECVYLSAGVGGARDREMKSRIAFQKSVVIGLVRLHVGQRIAQLFEHLGRPPFRGPARALDLDKHADIDQIIQIAFAQQKAPVKRS